MANRSWGAYRLRAELQQRGIAGQWIEQALASEVDESVLREKAEAFVRKSGFPTDPAAKRKLAQKLTNEVSRRIDQPSTFARSSVMTLIRKTPIGPPCLQRITKEEVGEVASSQLFWKN